MSARKFALIIARVAGRLLALMKPIQQTHWLAPSAPNTSKPQHDPPTPLAPVFLADDVGGIGVCGFDLLGIKRKVVMQCFYCEDWFKTEDVRPYGPKGEYTCFKCAMKPGNKAATDQMFSKTLDACGSNVVLEDTGLRPANSSDITKLKSLTDSQ
jgi:hypothetical protein